ncbi:efflux RND transporter periplasmic adaptor subunit [Planococcus salinus]|uniref:Efflux RND transporter periplasmic adaptor subunit n=1 Tax=Planococcus salinus TaxID=1848460 RepID=A0A3M8P8K5_9BACL|nr:efflux RND transporter periplasmic adaptor subunit [Planococcus salinus]RNF39993.1 efflux RND transporter periplasmic adaptor subunit [Planococcus salinus]
MNKFFFIGLSIAITSFLAANAILMYGEKSVLTKTVYVSEYEQAFASTYTEELQKEAITTPLGSTQIYVQQSDAIEQWLVSEGDIVEAGAELALLNEAESEEQRAVWESERDALEDELAEIRSVLSDLKSARRSQRSSTTERASDRSTTTNEDGDTVELDVNVTLGVEVPQDGSFAAGIAQAEQQLAAVESKLAVVEAQLAQTTSNPALISPVAGVVAKVNGDSEPMNVEIYSHEKVFTSYLSENEWPDIEIGDRVLAHAPGLEQALPATVMKVDQVPAEQSKWLTAYQELEPHNQKNPIAFYEVQFATDEPLLDQLPYGGTANANIVTNEVEDAVALPQPWIYDNDEDNGVVHILSMEGYATDMPVSVEFNAGGKAILADGVEPGTIVLKEENLRDFNSLPAVFMPFPDDQPDFILAKSTNWRHYVEYLLAR